MDDITEHWIPQPLDVYLGSVVRPTNAEGRLFAWKAAALLVATVALVPVLWLQNLLGGAVYVMFLLVVHAAGLVVFLVGVKRQNIGVTPRGMSVRLGGLVALMALLYLASKGLQGGLHSAAFWISLCAVWLLHTAGAAMLNLLPEKRPSLCPFL